MLKLDHDPDDLILAMINRLPERGGSWFTVEREQWLEMMKRILGLCFKETGEDKAKRPRKRRRDAKVLPAAENVRGILAPAMAGASGPLSVSADLLDLPASLRRVTGDLT